MFILDLAVTLIVVVLKSVVAGFGFVVGAVGAIKLAEKLNIRV